MKTGILTFHQTNNYGASLQAYALYKVLSLTGIDVSVINYQNLKMQNDLRKAYCIDKSTTKRLVQSLVSFPDLCKRKKAFENFQKNLKLSGPLFHSQQELKEVSQQYDRIICGSDQVWNYIITADDYSFYLEFLEEREKKASYAASFGLEKVAADRREKVSKLISEYKYLAVREKQAVDIVKDLTGRQAELVLDPTLLLTRKEWEQAAKPVKSFPTYILIYTFGSKSLEAFARKLSLKTGLPILHIDGSVKNKWSSTYRTVRGLGPAEWVYLFQNAEYVVTNSFHGTAFAINFNKKFFTEMLLPPAKVNSRLENILQMFGLQNRQIVNGDNADMTGEIDYKRINIKLDEEREKSLSYLKRVTGAKNGAN